ncbi:MAG: HAD family hydrolase [Methanobrevibacter sp.]|nr:HAD family hydrolase [Methanobrevibacter sp.]
MKKLAIFDFDGTLFNTVDDVIINFNVALKANGFPTLTREEYIERLGGNIDEIVSLILNDRNTPENIELIKREYGKLYADSKKENSKPFPDVLDLLMDLERKDVLIAINSNRTTPSIKQFVEKYLPDIDFLEIEGHNLDYPSKPSPFGVNRIIEKAGVSLDEAIYIGDSKTDIKTAQNAGIDCVIVKWGYGNQKDYENEYIMGAVDSICEILNYF